MKWSGHKASKSSVSGVTLEEFFEKNMTIREGSNVGIGKLKYRCVIIFI